MLFQGDPGDGVELRMRRRRMLQTGFCCFIFSKALWICIYFVDLVALIICLTLLLLDSGPQQDASQSLRKSASSGSLETAREQQRVLDDDRAEKLNSYYNAR